MNMLPKLKELVSNKRAINMLVAGILLVSSCFGIISYLQNQQIKDPFKNLIFPVEEVSTGKMGYMDISGQIVIEPKYEIGYGPKIEFDNDWNGLALAETEEGVGIIDKNNNVVFPFTLNYLEFPPKNYQIVAGQEDESVEEWPKIRFGLFALSGTMQLPMEYKRMSEFINGKAIVQKNDYYWYIIDESGSVVEKLDESITYINIRTYSTGYLAFTRMGSGKDYLSNMDEW